MKSATLGFMLLSPLLPELRRARSDAERSLLVKASRIRPIIRFTIFLIVMTLLVLPAWIAPGTRSAARFSVLDWLNPLLPAIPLLILVIVVPLSVRESRRIARQTLAARGLPLCRRCAYDLSATLASEQPRCPECGEPVSGAASESIEQSSP